MSEKNTSTKFDEHFPRWNRMVRQERERREREGTNKRCHPVRETIFDAIAREDRQKGNER